MKKKVVFHWVGTDLLLAHESITAGIVRQDYLDKPVHLTDSPWFVDELAALGISARYAPLLVVIDPPDELPLPEPFSVLAYIPEGKEKMYGFDHLIAAASEMPETIFSVAGLPKYDGTLPENIKLLGWVSHMPALYRESSVVVRMPQHDGLSFFVLESLMYGRHVIYNQPFQHCRMATDAGELIAELRDLRRQFQAGTLKTNTEGRNFVLGNFTKEKVIGPLAGILTSR
jgi:hypothetical protein